MSDETRRLVSIHMPTTADGIVVFGVVCGERKYNMVAGDPSAVTCKNCLRVMRVRKG